MNRHFDRYFELFPLILIILILVSREYRDQSRSFERTVRDTSFSSLEVQVPRLILR